MNSKKPKLKWPLTIKTKRLILRPYKASDFKEWVKTYGGCKPAQNDFDTGPKPKKELNRARFLKVIRNQRARAKLDSTYVWLLFHKRSNELVGMIDIYIFDRNYSQSANLGYRIFNQYWGHGYGAEAARAAAAAAFKHLKLHRLEATISPNNALSLKLIKKLGFKKEGIRRKTNWDQGRWQDELVFYATPDLFGLPMKAPQVRRPY